MACGACKKKSTKKTSGEVEENKSTSILTKIGAAVLALVVATIALPILFVVLVAGLYQGWAGDGFDLSKIVNMVKKKDETKEEVEEINPEDYELVGVDKIG